jgi:hypothetical protein
MNFALNIEKSCRLYQDKICVVPPDFMPLFDLKEKQAR